MANYFDRWAYKYDKVFGFFLKPFYNKVIPLIKKEAKGKVLDVGCGTGTIAIELVNNNKITGIDISENMIKIARSKNNKVKFIVKDAEKLDLKEKFNLIYSTLVLHHVNAEVVVENIYKRLKKNGRLIIVDVIKDNFIGKLLYWLEKIVDKKVRVYTKKEIIELLERNKFNVLDVKKVYSFVCFFKVKRL